MLMSFVVFKLVPASEYAVCTIGGLILIGLASIIHKIENK